MAHFASETPSEMVSTHLHRTLLVALGRRGRATAQLSTMKKLCQAQHNHRFQLHAGRRLLCLLFSLSPYLQTPRCFACVSGSKHMCLPSLGGFRKEYRQQIPPPEWADGAACVTDTLLRASREVSKQPASQAVSNSSEPAASLYTPSPSVGPSPWALPGPGCWRLPRTLIWHVGTAKVVSAHEGQTPSHGRPLGLAMEGGKDLCARI